MKDPGPNLLEQQIETNRLLAAIAAGAAASGPSSPGVAGGVKSQWPILFYWNNGDKHPFILDGTGAYDITVDHSDGRFLSNDTSLQIRTQPTTPAVGDFAEARIAFWAPLSRVIRVQLAFKWWTTILSKHILARLEFYDRTNHYTGELRLNPLNGSVEYQRADGDYTLLDNYVFVDLANVWNKIDLVVDFAAGKYYWASVNHFAWDLSAIDCGTEPDAATRPYAVFAFQVLNQVADTVAGALLDEVLITEHLYMGPVT